MSGRDQCGSVSVVTNAGDHDGITVYFHDSVAAGASAGRIIETRDGSSNVVQQIVRGVRYIDEIVMMRRIDKGDLYVHQGERSDRERAAIGKADMDVRIRPAARPKGVSTKRTTGGANWNVIFLTDLGGSVVERYVYNPYGQFVVQQETSYGDRDGDGDVDGADKGLPGVTCTGTVAGACRILDLDFDGDYDAADATKFDALDQGLARHPGRRYSGVEQVFAHQGLLYEPEIGSYHNRARQYHPTLRRFVQRDPLVHRTSSILDAPAARTELIRAKLSAVCESTYELCLQTSTDALCGAYRSACHAAWDDVSASLGRPRAPGRVQFDVAYSQPQPGGGYEDSLSLYAYLKSNPA
ncbi:MAG: hypothetical protein IID36_12675, partial [Planctomycetes bacterium]|nr:hypothetical protein [Planctomycetota bacterium]